MVISAKPIVGEKYVNLAKLSLWIEEKLTGEFQREFVIPNMVEIRSPIMCGNYKFSAAKSKSKRSKTTI